jgi:hypothetical protein
MDTNQLLIQIVSDLAEQKQILIAQNKTHDTFRQELLGDGGRIKNLEDDAHFQGRVQWIFQICVLPVVFALHKLATSLGLKI